MKDNDLGLLLQELPTGDLIDFTAESSDTSVVSFVEDPMTSNTFIYLTAKNPGSANMTFTVEDGRQTWCDVIVVDSIDDMPEFT